MCHFSRSLKVIESDTFWSSIYMTSYWWSISLPFPRKTAILVENANFSYHTTRHYGYYPRNFVTLNNTPWLKNLEWRPWRRWKVCWSICLRLHNTKAWQKGGFVMGKSRVNMLARVKKTIKKKKDKRNQTTRADWMKCCENCRYCDLYTADLYRSWWHCYGRQRRSNRPCDAGRSRRLER